MAKNSTAQTMKTLIEELRKYGNREVMLIVEIKKSDGLMWFIDKLLTRARTVEIRGHGDHVVVSTIIDSRSMTLIEKRKIEETIQSVVPIITNMNKSHLIYVGPADVYDVIDTPAFMARFASLPLRYSIQPLPA